MAYEDTVLLKLRRDYSKDEALAFCFKKIKELQIENGKNKAYIDELESEKKKDMSESIKTKRLEDQVKTLKENNNNLKPYRTEYPENKILSLENKLEKQFVHGKIMEDKAGFVFTKLKSILSENEMIEFYKEADLFEEKIKIQPVRGNLLKSMIEKK